MIPAPDVRATTLFLVKLCPLSYEGNGMDTFPFCNGPVAKRLQVCCFESTCRNGDKILKLSYKLSYGITAAASTTAAQQQQQQLQLFLQLLLVIPLLLQLLLILPLLLLLLLLLILPQLQLLFLLLQLPLLNNNHNNTTKSTVLSDINNMLF